MELVIHWFLHQNTKQKQTGEQGVEEIGER